MRTTTTPAVYQLSPFIQWLFDDHVDALIKDKYLDVYSTIFQHLQQINYSFPEAIEENVNEDDFEDDKDSKG